MKYYVIAGEASGDLHGGNLIHHLKNLDGKAEFRAWGGDKIEEEGATLVKHYRELAFMGFTEVLMNLSTILNNLKFCKKDIIDFKPDVLILIDYPGFNLRIAEFAHANNIKVFYYISPQIWAWKQSRIKIIKKVVDRMFVILPFEEEFYKKFNFEVSFQGHPLLDEIEKFKSDSSSSSHDNKKIIALLPGSRKQEVNSMLPVMIKATETLKDYDIYIGQAPSLDEEFYNSIISGSHVKLFQGNTYQLLSQSHAALVTSGTATLEAALFKVPQLVCYKGGWISYYLAKKLIKVKYISLVNLILDKKAVPELIQDDMNKSMILKKLKLIINESDERHKMLSDYDTLQVILGGSGASERFANEMYQRLLS